MERKNRKLTPVHFKIEYAVSERAKIADKPIALHVPQINKPVLLPNTESSAAFLPPKMDWRSTIATP